MSDSSLSVPSRLPTGARIPLDRHAGHSLRHPCPHHSLPRDVCAGGVITNAGDRLALTAVGQRETGDDVHLPPPVLALALLVLMIHKAAPGEHAVHRRTRRHGIDSTASQSVGAPPWMLSPQGPPSRQPDRARPRSGSPTPADRQAKTENNWPFGTEAPQTSPPAGPDPSSILEYSAAGSTGCEGVQLTCLP